MILIIFATSSCSFNLPASKSVHKLSKEVEEYAVYSVVLRENFVRDDVKSIVINEQTSSIVIQFFISSDDEEQKKLNYDELNLVLQENYPSVNKFVIKDFVLKNKKSSILSLRFDLPIEYSLFDKSKYKKGKEDFSVESFLEKYPKSRGYINLSQVGFNKDRTEAFLSFEFICFALCGGGYFILLEKNDEFWKTKKVFSVWKS